MLTLRSFKLRFADEHVRVVPSVDATGCPFSGPGVDLRGSDARAAFQAARPLLAALEAFEPGIVVRSIAVDLERPRLTATLDLTAGSGGDRPRVVRIDAGAALTRLLAAAAPVVDVLAPLAASALAARARGA